MSTITSRAEAYGRGIQIFWGAVCAGAAFFLVWALLHDLRFLMMAVLSGVLLVLAAAKLVSVRRDLVHDVTADHDGLRRAGPLGWQFTWADLASITITRREQWPADVVVTPKSGQPRRVQLDDDAAQPLSALAAAHGVVVLGPDPAAPRR